MKDKHKHIALILVVVLIIAGIAFGLWYANRPAILVTMSQNQPAGKTITVTADTDSTTQTIKNSDGSTTVIYTQPDGSQTFETIPGQ